MFGSSYIPTDVRTFVIDENTDFELVHNQLVEFLGDDYVLDDEGEDMLIGCKVKEYDKCAVIIRAYGMCKDFRYRFGREVNLVNYKPGQLCYN